METIKYRFADGHTEDVEVNDETAAALAEFERQDESYARTARRRKEVSIDAVIESGREPADCRNIEADYEESERKEEVLAVVSKLSEKQWRLVQLYYYEEKTEKEIARELGTSQQAVSQQLTTIHAVLKKYFEKN